MEKVEYEEEEVMEAVLQAMHDDYEDGRAGSDV